MALQILIDSEAKATTLQWVPVTSLSPHPKNPRIGTPDKLDSIIASMRVVGYKSEKPMLIRPLGDGYQIIGGHSRYAAAQAVGLEKVPCVIEEMDDDKAILRIAEDNLNDPLPWYSVCLYVFQNAVKDSKKGLSRTALVMAATGKGEGTAAMDGKRRGDAGEIVNALILQSNDVVRLLDPEVNRTYHLCEIKQAPASTWSLLAGLLVEHTWSVKDTKAAVERVNGVMVVRAAWMEDIHVDLKKVAIEPGYAKSTTSAFTITRQLHDKLDNSVTLYRLEATTDTKQIDGREYCRHAAQGFEYHPRSEFATRIKALDNLTATAAEKEYREIGIHINHFATEREEWRPVLTDAEEQDRAKRLAEIARMSDREAFTPRMLHGDVFDKLRTLPSDSFDLVCIDPPYNMDKAEWDSLGSGKEFAAWASPWLKECQRVLKPSGAIYVFGINRMLSHLQHEMDGLGLVYRNWITWDTIQGAGGGLWVNRTEAILYYGKTDDTFEDSDAIKLERHEENVREFKGREYNFKNPSNIWRFPCVDDKHGDRTEHPTQKPVELIERIVLASSPREGRVLDCFMGSGTTGVAAMKNRRYCTGIDQSEQYIAIAHSRFATTEVPAV